MKPTGLSVFKLDDKQDNAYFGRGMALGRMGLVDEGIADLSVFILRHPESSVAYTKRGVRSIWRNNLPEAYLVPSAGKPICLKSAARLECAAARRGG